MTTRIIFVRHGETDWNAAGRWQGHAPVPLNDTGRQQSAALGAYLAQNGTHIDVLYSSDLKRAMQTAAAIGAVLDLPVQTEPRLREIDLGEWQGLTRAESAQWDPERFASYQADWRDTSTPNGESRRQVQARARAAFDDLVARHAGQTIGMVTHGGTLGMLIESLFGEIKRPTLSNTSITIVEREAPGDEWSLARVAWTPHLEQGGALGETW